MVARQLFDACWDSGLVLVATSNRPPEALYEGGPNRQYFSPFITGSCPEQCRVVCLDGESDHRRLRLSRSDDEEAPPVRYLVQHLGKHTRSRPRRGSVVRVSEGPGCGPGGSVGLAPRSQITPDICPRPGPLAVHCERTVEGAVFAFDALCGSERGAGDFHAIARAFPVYCDR